ncbi:MAG: hypothetical protein IJV00_10025 [Clostridia bacterium]|nr:hypothetical protein [Clostridia bacterium]
MAKKLKLRVSSFDVEPSGFARPSSLLRAMQQAAREDLDQFGMTYPRMRSNGVVFVLYALDLELNEPLIDGAAIDLETYSIGVRGAAFRRDFRFFLDGRFVGGAVSKWVLLDFEKRRIAHPSRLGVVLPDHADKALDVELDKRLDIDGAESAGERTVYRSMTDENEHLNNCVYADIATDCLSYGKDEFISSIEILFQHEASQGDVLELKRSAGEGYTLVGAFNKTKQTPCFVSRIKTEKSEKCLK